MAGSLLIILGKYGIKYKPSYWLFEEIEGGEYSVHSMQKLFSKAVKESELNSWATAHTLSHSFPTHLLMEGESARYLQSFLGGIVLVRQLRFIHM